MSSTTTTSLQSLVSFTDSFPTKKHLNSQFKRAMFSSLRVKKIKERPSIGKLCESQWSLHSANSLSTDEFNWSLQPNYLKMMNDTNLMDNCAAAKEEIESIREFDSMGQLQFLETNKSETQRTTVDPEQLLQWIVYMEKYLDAFSPNWKQVNEMNEQQRDVSFNEQCDLRQYIASHNRIFNQMIKEEDCQRTRNVQEKFHKLLLNSIEKQCLLEGYSNVEEDPKLRAYDYPDINLDVYKLCSIDIEYLNHTLIRPSKSSESLASNSDTGTIITSDDGIHFPTHPTTSKSSLFSEEHYSPFSSHVDFQCGEYERSASIMKELDNIGVDSKVECMSDELQKDRKASTSSISASTLQLIKNVDSVLPRAATPNIDEYLHANNKVDNWLFHQPNDHFESKYKRVADVEKKIVHKTCSTSSSGSSSELGSTVSIQWDNFQDIYTLTVPIHEEPNNDFLYFGDDYDDALKSKRDGSLSSISDMLKSSTSAPTTPSKSEKSLPKCLNSIDERCPKSKDETIVSRKKKRVSRKLNKNNDSVIQPSIPNDSSNMAKDILLIVEDLRSNYMNLKPQDFDGILRICRENLGCLIVVLDKEQRHHYRSNESVKSVGDDRIYIQENCQCGVIGQFVARIVRFLYDCSRRVRRSVIYRFLLKILKHFYTMVKFLSHKVRVYRSLYGKY